MTDDASVMPFSPRTCLFNGCQRRSNLYELSDAWDMNPYGMICAEHGAEVGELHHFEVGTNDGRMCIIDKQKMDGWRLVLTFGRDHHERLTLFRPGEEREDA